MTIKYVVTFLTRVQVFRPASFTQHFLFPKIGSKVINNHHHHYLYNLVISDDALQAYLLQRQFCQNDSPAY